MFSLVLIKRKKCIPLRRGKALMIETKARKSCFHSGANLATLWINLATFESIQPHKKSFSHQPQVQPLSYIFLALQPLEVISSHYSVSPYSNLATFSKNLFFCCFNSNALPRNDSCALAQFLFSLLIFHGYSELQPAEEDESIWVYITD